MDESIKHIFKLQSEICKTLADPKRLMILHELRDSEKSVGQLVSSLELPQSNISHHLSIMRERGIVTARRDGTTIYYRLASPKIGQACDLVQGVLKDQMSNMQSLAGSIGS
jgi:DNA-binding transcriptional ArsR family regulator